MTGQLKGVVEYNADLFDRATIDRMLGHYVRLLEGVVADTGQRVSQLPLLGEEERRQLLVGWNETASDYPRERCVHELFEEQVERTPERVAVEFEGEQLGYRELNRRANQVANYLRKKGVGPEVRVGICVERSWEMVVGLLGILKAGGAYVPLDPSYPAERLSYMMEDSGIELLLTGQRVAESFSWEEQEWKAICLDSDWAEIGTEVEESRDSGVSAENLAYVIYTSGSTGKPKGVMICHRNASALLYWGHTVFHEEDLRGVLFSTSICFDLSVFELFLPLSWGGTVILAENALALPTLAARDRVTLVNTVPSAAAELFRLGGLPTSIRTMNLAGEPLSTELADQAYAAGIARVYDLYGPSEDTTYTSAALRKRGGTATIGRPLANKRIYILDRQKEPVPIGIAGEIYIGGDGLARGYLNDPALTAAKFVPDPFSGDSYGRLYRTGDLGRYLPDGNLEFLGRADHQVKVRGFRIELGEIESLLGQHSEIRQAVVVVRGEGSDKQLVSYLVAAAEKSPPVEELRRYLSQKLPAYMVPSLYVELESLPLTPNGKVDRRALPEPDIGKVALETEYAGPRTGVEQVLVEIWADVLGVARVGIRDNFFDLGGHSLKATQVMARVAKTLQVELPLRKIFESPTIAELADQIEQAGSEAREVEPIRRLASREGAELSFAQQRLWFLDQYEPGSGLYNIPAAVRLKGELDEKGLEWALGEIVKRHETLRTRFESVDGEPVQRIVPEVGFQLPVQDLSGREGAEDKAAKLVNEQARRAFDLSRDLMLRAQLIKVGDREHVLTVVLHHIASDGWSMGVLFKELSHLYQCYVKGESSSLPELEIQYADYAVWQREWLTGEELDRQVGYWQKQLEAAPGLLQLPTDHPRPAVQSHRGRQQSFELTQELTAGLKQLSRRQGTTLYMTLLAVFKVLLYRYTGQTDIVVGSPIAGRKRKEVEDLIGFFLNTLALRTRLSEDLTFEELLQQVKGTALEAYEHQDVPFEKLLEELRVERDLSWTPLFQVFFNMLNPGMGGIASLRLSGLEVEPLSVSEVESKFDLTVYLSEREQRIHLSVVYNADLFSKERIEELLVQYEYLLDQVVAEPEAKIGGYSLVSFVSNIQLPDPKLSLDSSWQGTVHSRFSEQARKGPENLALVDRQQEWTYRELEVGSKPVGTVSEEWWSRD